MDVISLDTVTSTMNEARRLLDEGQPPPFAVSAQTQTSGRGRRGTPWHSPLGGIWMTAVLLEETLAQPFGVLAPLAIRDALIETCRVDRQRLLVKWPNDLLLDGKKVSGTLCERPRGGLLLVGIGVNADFDASELPPELAKSATTLRSNGVSVGDPGALASEILAQLSQHREVDELNDALAYVGETVRGRGADGSEVEGTINRVHRDGSLLLDTPQGEVSITSDAVHLVRPSLDERCA